MNMFSLRHASAALFSRESFDDSRDVDFESVGRGEARRSKSGAISSATECREDGRIDTGIDDIAIARSPTAITLLTLMPLLFTPPSCHAFVAALSPPPRRRCHASATPPIRRYRRRATPPREGYHATHFATPLLDLRRRRHAVAVLRLRQLRRHAFSTRQHMFAARPLLFISLPLAAAYCMLRRHAAAYAAPG